MQVSIPANTLRSSEVDFAVCPDFLRYHLPSTKVTSNNAYSSELSIFLHIDGEEFIKLELVVRILTIVGLSLVRIGLDPVDGNMCAQYGIIPTIHIMCMSKHPYITRPKSRNSHTSKNISAIPAVFVAQRLVSIRIPARSSNHRRVYTVSTTIRLALNTGKELLTMCHNQYFSFRRLLSNFCDLLLQPFKTLRKTLLMRLT